MALGSGSLGSSGQARASGGGMPLAGIAVVLIIGLVIGFAAGNYFPMLSGSSAQQGGKTVTKLSDEDKNFLVQMANAQVGLTTQLTAQQSALVDWCTAGGGQWITNQRQGQVNVTSQQAQQLQAQGAQVVQQDGNFLASVVLFDRSSCIVVPTAQNAQGGQQAGAGQ